MLAQATKPTPWQAPQPKIQRHFLQHTTVFTRSRNNSESTTCSMPPLQPVHGGEFWSPAVSRQSSPRKGVGTGLKEVVEGNFACCCLSRER